MTILILQTSNNGRHLNDTRHLDVLLKMYRNTSHPIVAFSSLYIYMAFLSIPCTCFPCYRSSDMGNHIKNQIGLFISSFDLCQGLPFFTHTAFRDWNLKYFMQLWEVKNWKQGMSWSSCKGHLKWNASSFLWKQVPIATPAFAQLTANSNQQVIQ